MASWHSLPYEIHLLIVNSYIAIVLADLDAIKHPTYESTTTASYRLRSFVFALPLLRKDVLRFCYSKVEMDDGFHKYLNDRISLEYMKESPTSVCLLTVLNQHWADESWGEFREEWYRRRGG